MWFISVEVEQETSAPPLKKNPGSAPVTEMLVENILKHHYQVKTCNWDIKKIHKKMLCYSDWAFLVNRWLEGAPRTPPQYLWNQ